MPRKKSIEQLRTELDTQNIKLEKAQQTKKQLERKLNILENRIETETRKKRNERTHMLCFKASHLESVFPVIKDSSKVAFVKFVEGLSMLPGVMEYVEKFVKEQKEE